MSYRRAMDRRPIILGESNPYSSRMADALSPYFPGSSGHRLWAAVNEATGMDREVFLLAFDRRNLCSSAWDDRVASAKAAWLRRWLRPGDVVVLLGRKVQRAMGQPPLGVVFHNVPHPSGLCRTYNNPEARRQVGLLLGRLAGVR